ETHERTLAAAHPVGGAHGAALEGDVPVPDETLDRGPALAGQERRQRLVEAFAPAGGRQLERDRLRAEGAPGAHRAGRAAGETVRRFGEGAFRESRRSMTIARIAAGTDRSCEVDTRPSKNRPRATSPRHTSTSARRIA